MILGMVAILALVLTVVGGAHFAASVAAASPGSPPDGPDTRQSAALGSDFISPVSVTGSVSDKVAEYAAGTASVDEATLAALLQAASVGQIETQSDAELDVSRAFADQTSDGAFMLRIPFAEVGGVLAISGYSVFFDANLQATGTGEVVFTQLTKSSGAMQLWQDDVLLVDRVASDPVTDSAEGDATTVFSWDVLNSCLLNAGISQWAITLIGVGCGVICGATLGTGCLACVIAVAGIGGATVGTCVANAMLA